MQHDEENRNADDFQQTYSALSTYTFGAASTSARRNRDADMLSPLAPIPGNDHGDSVEGFSDRTPRPSISHPRNDEDDDEETARRDRAKMRAIDDGGRRPSLPSNVSAAHASPSGHLISPPASAEHRDTSSADEEGDYSARSSTPEGGHEGGALDTDVELEDIAPDTASQNTFGMGSYRPRGSRPYRQPWDLSDSDAESENERRWDIDPSESPGPNLSPVTFSRPRDSDEGSTSTSPGYAQSTLASIAAGRRGSLPIAIPGRGSTSDTFSTAPILRDREDSIATLRRPSRSVDDDLRAINPVLGGTGASEPTTRADWQAFEEDHAPFRADEMASGSNALDGIDLNYILGRSNSRRSSNSFMQPLPAPPAKGKGKQREKGKGKAREGPSLRNNMAEFFSSRSDADSSLTGPASAMADIAPWSMEDPITGRRPSTITVGTVAEDTFAGHVRSADPQGIEELSEWLFRMLESRDPQSRRQNKLQSRENWYCEQIGRIVLQRLEQQGTGEDKPVQQRMRVHHEVDPRCKGNALGGPASVVHKHSRTTAFSIFRRYNIPAAHTAGEPRPPPPPAADPSSGGGSSSVTPLDPMNCILLAAKDVQMEYTNTQSTKMLSTHGLLEDRSHRSRRTGGGGDRSRSREPGSAGQASTSERRPTPPTVPPVPEVPRVREVPRLDRRIVDQNALAQSMRPSTASSTADSQAATSSTQSSLDLSRSMESATSHGSTAVPRRAPPLVGPATVQDSSDSDSDDYRRQPTRTSHAEAFATLDPVTLEQIRANPASQPSVSSWFRRRRNPTVARNVQNSITPVNPPWMQLTSRAHQDKNNRTLADLNQSFQEVGLLPAYRKRGSSGIGRTGKTTGSSLLNHVPDDSIFMLLPLWPYETDAQSHAAEPWSPRIYEPELQKRLYLLVYYVGLGKKGKEVASSERKKPRSRSVSGRGEPSGSSSRPKSIYLPNHHATARLVSYSDLNGSGVRLPTRGLSVTGSMTAAISGIPPAALRDVHRDDFVVAFHQKREKGVQIIPDGLEKLGLCKQRPADMMRQQAAPGMQVAEFPDDNEPQPLTAIGRAAVELIWLGCMAVTKFEGH
ncbi:hypothetical protein DENSPDRAFT_880722 [Dentipellis sp. KUC8613]|nr:hypothetical protein DENSPDRAFT_880722 [Dentipellis sp. KUC8613]